MDIMKKTDYLFLSADVNGRLTCRAYGRDNLLLRQYRPRGASRYRLESLLSRSVTYVFVGPYGPTVRILRGVG